MHQKVLPSEMSNRLKSIVNNDEQFDAKLWAKIVYHFAASYKNLRKSIDKERLIDALKTLWIGRFTSYAMETTDMDINEAEHVIQKQASVFEEQFDYLKFIF